MLETLARMGYASKAVIYGIVGLLATLAVLNQGGRITDTSGALREVVSRPFGRILLILLAIGLCGYAIWRFLDAAIDPDRDGTSPGGLMTRLGNATRGLVYGALGVEAITLVRGLSGSGGDQAEFLASRILDLPLGWVIVGIIGTTVAAYGASQVVQGIQRADHKVDWTSLRPDLRVAAQRICRFGVITRGGVIATLGVFLVRAAWSENPDQAAGPRESMLVLGRLFDGGWFLAILAVGLIAYAVDQGIHARCRRIRPVL